MIYSVDLVNTTVGVVIWNMNGMWALLVIVLLLACKPVWYCLKEAAEDDE